MDKFQHPEPLSFQGNLSENWRKWKQRFELYMTASDNSSKSDEIKSAILLHMAGPEALEIYNAFTWDEEADKKKVDKIMEKFKAYCTPCKNVTWGRHVFNSRTQQPGETIDQHVTDLCTKAAQCEFGTLTDSLIHDRIVCGVLNDRSRLLKDSALTLDGAIDICRADEATAARMKSLATGEKDPSDKDLDLKLLKKGTKSSHAGHRQGQRTGAKQQEQCGNCGG